MIRIEDAKGGLLLSRDDDPNAPPLFVATEELAAFLAELLSRATDASEAAEWDAYAALAGNTEITLALA